MDFEGLFNEEAEERAALSQVCLLSMYQRIAYLKIRWADIVSWRLHRDGRPTSFDLPSLLLVHKGIDTRMMSCNDAHSGVIRCNGPV